MALEYHFGIDFGTTNSSTVGYYRASGDAQWVKMRFEDEEGLPTPSFVAIDRATGEVHSGRDAWNRRMELSSTCECIPSVKSLLDSGWKKTIAGKTWTACDVATQVFLALKKTAYEGFGAEIASATVAIPIGFSPSKREQVRRAATCAGIAIESFISEPTAAYFANYNELKSCETVAMFDWGGGTLDVSVVENNSGCLTELATNGIKLGGDDIDRKVALKIHSKVARDKGQPIAFDDMPLVAQDRILVKAERAKRVLSDDDDTSIFLGSYGELGAFREPLSYEWFEAIIEPEINKAMKCLEDTISDSGVGLANIDRVVMIGGSSNLRPLLERMEEKYGDKIFFPDETMWSIGDGAARLSINPGMYYAAQDLGLILSDGSYFPILRKGEKVKGWNSSTSFGLVDHTEDARLIFAGSRDLDRASDRYWVFTVPQYGFLQEKIILKSSFDDNLIFKVAAKSSMKPSKHWATWDYDRLKCYYRLSELGL